MNSGDNSAYPCDHPTRGGLGLTKRELFAAMAMQGLCARDDGEPSYHRAAYAVEHADELLAALEKSK